MSSFFNIRRYNVPAARPIFSLKYETWSPEELIGGRRCRANSLALIDINRSTTPGLAEL